MPPPAAKSVSERAGKGAPGGGPREERAKRVPAPKPGWTLTLEGLAAMSPTQRHRHLLFGDLLKDVGAAASIFPRESVELEYLMPDPRAWTQCELPTERWNRLLGVLKAAEARGRVRALRLRYTRMRVGREPRAGAQPTGKTTRPAGAGGGWVPLVPLGAAPLSRLWPAGRGDRAPDPAAGLGARRHQTGDIPATTAETHANSGSPGSARGSVKPWMGGRTPRLLPH